MKKKKAEQEPADVKEEAGQQRVVTFASLLIKRDGRKFFRELQQKLEISVRFLPALGLTGSTSPLGDGVRVSVICPGILPIQTYTDLFWTQEVGGIRCSGLNIGAYTLQFRVTPDNRVTVLSSRSGYDLMNPEEACEHVMKAMIDLIDSQR
ncbi:MAG: hypothetical protein ACHP8B_15665 [Terriglobales bacterium]